MKGEPVSFKLGEIVSWTSQAQGGWTRKVGTIHRIVPSGEWPHLSGSGFPRDHESYIVAVEVGKRVKRTKLYWPRVSALEHGQ